MCRGAAKLLGPQLAEDGIKKVLIVIGMAAAKKIGAYDDVVGSLRAANVAFKTFEGVRPNLELSTAAKAADIIRQPYHTETPVKAVVVLGSCSAG